jgi:hypothetical protein
MSAISNKAALASALAGMEDNEEGRAAIARLQEQDLLQIDQAILASLDRSWKKAGFVTAGVMIAAPDAHEEIPESFYVLRIRALAEASRIEVKGDLEDLKTSEIRRSAQEPN